MAYESDEEQIEALKNWWNENGTSLIVGVVIVVVVLFGSRQWQGTRVNSVEAASTLYQNMAESVLTNATASLSDELLAEVEQANQQLRNDFDKSIYTRYAGLLMGKVYVERSDLEKAAIELQWVVDNPDLGLINDSEEELFLTARLRLARVLLAQDEAQAAIDLLREVEAGAFSASFAEFSGDAHLSLGQIGDARAAYQLALETAVNSELLTLKIEDLGN